MADGGCGWDRMVLPVAMVEKSERGGWREVGCVVTMVLMLCAAETLRGRCEWGSRC